MSLKKDFGKRLKELRQKRGLTQFQLAEKVEIDPKHLSHIETGRSFPKADLIEKFADVLSVEYNAFFNVQQLKSKEDIISEINFLLNNSNDEKLRIIYNFILNI